MLSKNSENDIGIVNNLPVEKLLGLSTAIGIGVPLPIKKLKYDSSRSRMQPIDGFDGGSSHLCILVRITGA